MDMCFTEELDPQQRLKPQLAALSAFISQCRAHPRADATLHFLETTYDLQPAILLTALWHAATGQGRLTRDTLQQLIDQTYHWHLLITLKLAACTRSATSHTALVDAIKDEKNRAHTIELLMILDHLPYRARQTKGLDQEIKNACHNMLRYCQLCQGWPQTADYNHFHQLLHIIWPQEEQIPSIFLHTIQQQYPKASSPTILPFT